MRQPFLVLLTAPDTQTTTAFEMDRVASHASAILGKLDKHKISWRYHTNASEIGVGRRMIYEKRKTVTPKKMGTKQK